MFADASFRASLLHTGLYALFTVVPSLVLALGVALALDGSGRVKALLRAVFFLPGLIPLVAAASIFLFLFLPGIGLIDYHLANPSDGDGPADAEGLRAEVRAGIGAWNELGRGLFARFLELAKA